MITESQIYWITRCDAIHTVLLVACVPFLAFTIFVFGLCIAVLVDDEARRLWGHALAHRLIPFWLIAAVPLISVKVFVPTTKEMALIKVAPALVNSELVQTTIPAEAKEIYALAKTALAEKLNGGAK